MVSPLEAEQFEEPDLTWGNIPHEEPEKVEETSSEEPKIYRIHQAGGKTVGTGSLRQILKLRRQLPEGYNITLIGYNKQIQNMVNAQYTYNQVYNEQVQLGDNGLPIDWDYHGELGPWGQPLPEGALGWDPYGRPDFGPGPVGWIKREWAEIVGNYNIPEEQLEDMKPVDDDEFDEYQRGLWHEGNIGEWATAWIGRAASEIRYKWAQMEYSENDPSVLSVGSRVVGSGFTALGDVFDALAGAVEWAITPAMLTGDDYIREGKTGINEDMYNIINNSWLLRPSSYLAKALIGQFATILDPKYRENIKQYRDLQIWRMGYSASKDVFLRAEYLRRMEQGGEDPRLLAMELADPGVEMGGRMFFDPLNIPAVAGLPGKIAKSVKVKMLGRAAETARMTRAVPVMSHVMDFLKEATKLSDEFSDSSKVMEVAKKIQEGYTGVRNGIVDLANRRNLAALTAKGKRTAMLTGSGHFIGTMAEHFSGNTNEFLEYLTSLVKMSSDNVDEVVDGLTTLGGLVQDPKMFEMALSEAGTETSIILRNLMYDASGELKDVSKMFGGMEDVADMVTFTNKMYDEMVTATKNVFPTLTEQIRLNDKLADMIKAGEDTADFLAKNPFAEVAVPQWQRMMDAAHQFVQPVYNLAAGAQGVLYMGLSPAYWLRNKFTNFAQIFVDQGAGPALKSLFFSKVHAENMIESYLGFVPKIEGFGGAASWAGKKPGGGVLHYFSGKAATDEARAAAHVMAESIRDTMSKGLLEGRIIPSTVGLTSFSDDMRQGIVRLAQQYNGDVDAVWKALREAKKAGGYDIARNLMFLSVDDINDIKKISKGLHSRITKDVLEAETLDDAIKALDDIAEDYAKQGSKHWNETVRLSEMNEIYAKIDDAMEGMKPSQREYVKDVISHQMLANQIAQKSADQAVESFRYDFIAAITQEIGDGDKAIKIMKSISDPMDELTDLFHGYASKQQLQLVASHKALTKRLVSVGRMKPAERAKALRGIWNEFDFGRYVDMPEELTSKYMRDAIWEVMHIEKRKNIWNGYRAAHFTIRRNEAVELMGAIRKAGAPFDANKILDKFRKADADLARAATLDNLVIRDGELFIKATPNMQDDFLGTLPEFGMTDRFADATKDERWEMLVRIAKEAEEEGLIPVYHAISGAERGGQEIAGYWVNEGHGVIARQPSSELAESRVAYIKQEQWDEFRELGAAREEGFQPMDGFIPVDADVRWQPIGSSPVKTTEGFIPIEEFMNDVPLGMGDDLASPVQHMSQTTHKVKELINKTKAGLRENWGQLREYVFDPRQERELSDWMKTMKERLTIARADALDIAQETRDFILHNYGSRRGIDQLLSYIYPYQFWHSRTYAKWLKRLVTEPEWIARYARYRGFLEKKHPGLPDWWKYQLNTNELLGLDSEHPLWFNLEATLNPLYGMTGVDFTSPDRRLDWWSSLMEDLNKVGPSIWTPYQLAAALIYHAQGKEEASSKWAGRMWTGTRFIRDATALMGFEGGKGVELDPFVNFFSGGLGPWERARVGRMLGQMQTEGKYTAADIIDAGYQQTGPIWDEAVSRAINERAPGQIAAFMLGAGFKPRSESDQQIDRMYNEIYGLMSNRTNFSDEEYRQGWDDLERRYPFMDAVLMSKKGGLERDEALAWNVLSRIPPGATDDMADMVGINQKDISSFYDYKGDLLEMPEAQRLRFKAAILDLAALLDLPPAATKAEWDKARQAYREMQERGKQIFGEDIIKRADDFYASDDQDSFLEHNPIVEEFLDWQQETIIMTPILASYYTSIARIEKYLKGEMYEEAEQLFGKDLWDLWEVYGQVSDIDSKAARQMWKDYPQFEGYIKFRDERLIYIAERVAQLGARIPEGLPAEFRQEIPTEEYTPDNSKEAWIEGMVLSYVSGGEGVSAMPTTSMDILNYLSQFEEPLYYLYLGYLNGQELPAIAKERLSTYGISVE